MRSRCAFLLLGCTTAFGLTHDELALLQDAGGWEYLTITDTNNGFQNQSTCFDKAFTGQCHGSLLFRTDHSFTQNISAHGRGMHRGGRYTIDGSSLTFWDEHNTQDGPYTVTIDQNTKSMRIETTQAGVRVEMNLLLESEFRKHKAR